MEQSTKQCSMCQEVKPVGDYYVKVKKTGRLFSWCKDCHRLRTAQWQADNKDRVTEVAKNWRAANPEKAKAALDRYRERHADQLRELARATYAEKRKEQKAAYRKANAAHIKKSNADYKQRNHDVIQAQNAIYREQNQDALRERSAQWRKENPERDRAIASAAYQRNRDKRLAYGQRRRKTHSGYYLAQRHIRIARIAGNGGQHTHEEWEALKARYDYRCLCCNRQEPDIRLTRDHIVPIVKGGDNTIANIQPLCLPCNRRKHTRTIDYRKDA